MTSLALLPAVAVGAALLVVSGAAKARDPRGALDGLGVSGRVSAAGMRVVGAAELALGVAVLARPTVGMTTALAAVYCLFAAVVEWQRRQPGITSCGCLGGRSAPPSRVHIALNLALAAAAGLAASSGGAPSPPIAWSASPALTLVAAIGIAGATALAAAVIRDLPVLLSSYQR